MLSPDYKVLIACCRYETEIAAIQTTFASFSEKDYLRLQRLAHRHGVYPLFYKSVKSAVPHSLSAKTEVFLQKSNLAIAQRNMLMSAELLQLMHLFDAKSIAAVAFKGPVLGQSAYGAVTLRQYGDLDILIRREAVEKTVSLLLERGYTPEIELEANTIETFYNCVNVIGLHKGTLRVEIHWKLLSKNYAIDWDEEKLWRDTETIGINRKPVKMLSFENHLLYLCAHGAKHLFERLEWICDIDRSIRAKGHVNWANLLDEAASMGIERMLLLGVGLSERLLDLPLPEEVSHRIKCDTNVQMLINKILALHYGSESTAHRSYSSFGLLWQMREKLSDRLRFGFWGLFAPKFDDFKFIALPKKLLFLYPIIRPYRLIAKYF